MDQNTTLRVTKITRIQKPTQVVNFTCDPHPYYYANGLLSHNCDSWYTSWKPEKPTTRITLNAVKQMFVDNPQIRHTMITGGGPTMHPELLQEMCQLAKNFGHIITIETEGSEFVQTVADFISLSPKFSNSTPIVGQNHIYLNRPMRQDEHDAHEAMRKNYEAMYYMITKHADFQIKPVISSLADLEELESLYFHIADHGCDVIAEYHSFREISEMIEWKEEFIKHMKRHTYCMPMGVTDVELAKTRIWLIEECVKRGLNYTDRLHIIAYGMKRGV